VACFPHLLALFQVADFSHKLLLVNELEVSGADLGFHISNRLVNLLSRLVGSSLVPDILSLLELTKQWEKEKKKKKESKGKGKEKEKEKEMKIRNGKWEADSSR